MADVVRRNNKAWIDNDLKIVDGSLSPGQGCVPEAPWQNVSASDVMPMLFNLTSDHGECSQRLYLKHHSAIYVR